MSNLQILRAEHSDLIRLVARLRATIVRDAPPPVQDISPLLKELSATLIGHLRDEDLMLYPSLIGSDDPIVASTARAFNEQMGGLAADYRTYAARWTSAAIESDWRGFCADSTAIVEALVQRILRENRELYPLLERHDRAA